MGKRKEPIALVEAKGRKHLTKAEKEEREASEPTLSAPANGEGSKIRPPSWLPEYLRAEFNDLRSQLVEAGIFSKLDRDTLGRYLVAQRQYTAAVRRVQDALDAQNVEDVAAWGREQERCFKQCRACAADLGLSISSRCRLVIPEGLRPPKEDPAETAFLQLLEGRRRNA